MPEAIVLAAALALAGVAVLWPLWSGRPATTPVEDPEDAAVRHRVALESLRDVEADHRSGSLDDEAYAEQRAEAEARAAMTLDRLEREPEPTSARDDPRGRRLALGSAAVIGGVLVVASMVEATGIANATVENPALAAAEATNAARQERIDGLLDDLRADPRDVDTLSDLADAYLEGNERDDLVRAAVALQLVIDLAPERPDAYERLMSAYLRAGDATNARAVHDAYAELDTADPVEVAFFDGLIALRGEDDPSRAADAFDTFLELAPDDPRASMIRALREEAEAGS
jgi:cytochrome c-type biogenesis protein CcmI